LTNDQGARSRVRLIVGEGEGARFTFKGRKLDLHEDDTTCWSEKRPDAGRSKKPLNTQRQGRWGGRSCDHQRKRPGRSPARAVTRLTTGERLPDAAREEKKGPFLTLLPAFEVQARDDTEEGEAELDGGQGSEKRLDV